MVNLNLITARLLNTGLIPGMTGMIMENALPADTVKILVEAEITETPEAGTTEAPEAEEITGEAAGITITGVAATITETITVILRRDINNYTD